MYTYPKLSRNKVVYKGKRYWIFETIEKPNFMGFDKSFCDLLMFDKLEDCVIATIKKTKRGFRVTLLSHVEIWYDFETLDDVAKSTPSLWDSYLDDCL